MRVEKSVQLRSEEHTSELQSQSNLVCRLLLEKKKPSETGKPTGPTEPAWRGARPRGPPRPHLARVDHPAPVAEQGGQGQVVDVVFFDQGALPADLPFDLHDGFPI